MSYFLEWKINWQGFPNPIETKARVLSWLKKEYNIVERGNKLHCLDKEDSVTSLLIADTKLKQIEWLKPFIIKVVFHEPKEHIEPLNTDYFFEWTINWEAFANPVQTKARVLNWLKKEYNIVERDNRLLCLDEKDSITSLWIAETKLKQIEWFKPYIVRMIYHEPDGSSEIVI